MREAAGIRPGDRVTAPARPEGGGGVERAAPPAAADAFRQRLEDTARRRPMKHGPFGAKTADEVTRVLRGED